MTTKQSEKPTSPTLIEIYIVQLFDSHFSLFQQAETPFSSRNSPFYPTKCATGADKVIIVCFRILIEGAVQCPVYKIEYLSERNPYQQKRVHMRAK